MRYEEIIDCNAQFENIEIISCAKAHVETIKNLKEEMTKELERVNGQVIADMKAKHEEEKSRYESEVNRNSINSEN